MDGAIAKDAYECITGADARYMEVSEALRLRWLSETTHHHQVLTNLAQKWRNAAQLIAERDDIAPFLPSGVRAPAAFAQATNEGVILEWCGDDPFLNTVYLVTWARLEQIGE